MQCIKHYCYESVPVNKGMYCKKKYAMILLNFLSTKSPKGKEHFPILQEKQEKLDTDYHILEADIVQQQEDYFA